MAPASEDGELEAEHYRDDTGGLSAFGDYGAPDGPNINTLLTVRFAEAGGQSGGFFLCGPLGDSLTE